MKFIVLIYFFLKKLKNGFWLIWTRKVLFRICYFFYDISNFFQFGVDWLISIKGNKIFFIFLRIILFFMLEQKIVIVFLALLDIIQFWFFCLKIKKFYFIQLTHFFVLNNFLSSPMGDGEEKIIFSFVFNFFKFFYYYLFANIKKMDIWIRFYFI